MKIKYLFCFLPIFLKPGYSNSQDTSVYKLRLGVPVVEFPQNTKLPSNYPSMNQALEWSNDFYEVSFLGIEALGNKLFRSKTKPYTRLRLFSNYAFHYVAGLGFSKFGSELPVPLGVWAHEEFHRSVLGVNDIDSKNGNWIINKWDGSVYGISDQTLEQFKASNINQLLYSYVAGVQYEILLNEKISLDGFYKRRSMPKASLLLYNAYYVFNYFRFSASSDSDSAKADAPDHESNDPMERDYSGSDLTAWVYDMFNPELPYSSREDFPDGEGLNRRIGFSDLTEEAQDYLVKQKKLSLLNFLNPSLFFINRIRLNKNLSFNFFAQYSPTHFGNDIAFYLPITYKKYDLLVNIHSYSNKSGKGAGIGIGLFNYRISEKIESDLQLNFWDQPESFFTNKNKNGGYFALKTKYLFNRYLSCFASINGKSDGWIIGNPYLESNLAIQVGLNYNIVVR